MEIWLADFIKIALKNLDVSLFVYMRNVFIIYFTDL